MKTSTILVLTYFGLLLGGILALFIATKNGESRDALAYRQQFELKQNDLSGFSVVVLQDSAKCKLFVADSNRVEWYQPKTLPTATMPLFVRNDTLYVKKSFTGNTWDVLIRCKSLKEVITAKGSCVRIIDPNLKELTLIGKGGEIYVENEHPDVNDEIIKNLMLNIRAGSKTEITITAAMKQLTSTLDNATLDMRQVYIDTQLIMLTLRDSASAQVYGCPSNISIVKDTTSWYRVQ